MAKVFRPSSREASILSKIESSKEHARRTAIHGIRDHAETLGNAIAMKLVENHLVETLCRADDFEIDYQIAPLRNLVQHPNVVSLYLTAFVIEKLINHKSVVDIFGSDADIYLCINQQVAKALP
jgi:phosphopantetheine adenylyltransferase